MMEAATTEIYTLSLHDALPICCRRQRASPPPGRHNLPRRVEEEPWPGSLSPLIDSSATWPNLTPRSKGRSSLILSCESLPPQIRVRLAKLSVTTLLASGATD